MPGWIIQGVRGEGKSLAAVGKIREYMLRGRPVATNLDLYLEHLLPADNNTIAYRLPDHPRLEDFELLPPAYDPKYKAEDMNGLLVLDELGTWLNSRNWNEKSRLKLMNWLFLSRKDHWDIILLAQDHEMIDAQLRNTLCDYLVQASRLDRQKIPYLAPLLGFLGFNAFMPRIHRYHVFYGMTTATAPVQTWTFTGKQFYDGYDTNQRFRDGFEALDGTLVDMRATYTYLPANYLTNQVHIDKLQSKIDDLKSTAKTKKKQVNPMAAKSTTKLSQAPQLKIILLVALLVCYFGYKAFKGDTLKIPEPPLATVPTNVGDTHTTLNLVSTKTAETEQLKAEQQKPEPKKTDHLLKNNFVRNLLENYRARASILVEASNDGLYGRIDFYDGATIVESLSYSDLHAFGVIAIRKPYGSDLLFDDRIYIATRFDLPS